VTFEILENITISEDSKKIISELNLLKDMGFKLAVDDFGIENSNFSRMLDIDLDFIKIDGMFIKDISKNPKYRMVAKAIVNLAKTMNIKTVAEYVENESVYNLVKECGIDYAQGFYVGKPKSNLIA
jgi:EAL domain-containing protein (putative c-di-GMP-specific phosphodiesterase class I)